MRRLTGSSLDRAEACPASTVLPAEESPPGEAAARGSRVHLQLENRDPELDDELAEVGSSIEEWWPEGGVHEALVWYDPVTRDAGWKKKPPGTHRDYSEFPETAVVGTLDYINPALGMVDDLKTGWKPPSPDTLQVGLGVVAVAEGSKVESLRGSITHRPGKKLPTRQVVRHSESSILLVRRRIDRLYGDHLLNKARVAAGKEPDYSPGPHCKYCPCRKVCTVKE